MVTTKQILAGRKAVEKYRERHCKENWKPEEHTPHYNQLLKELGELGFDSIAELFSTSDVLERERLSLESDASIYEVEEAWK